MKSQDVPIKSGTIKVMMKSDSEVLQEVVVTGMQKMDKRLFTGATKQLNADNVKLDGLPDISRGLEGRAAGVSVQNVSGTFGTAPKIRVRGATSIYGSSKPLWVVDGVILEDAIDVGPDDLSSGDAETLISSAIAGLNSDDIESFQILKDGSATSIYGARAMAGVIVVTTKKGRAGVSKISYTGEFTTRAIPSYKEFNIMNSQEQMGIYKEMEQKGWLNSADLFRTRDTGVYGRMYRLIDEYNNSNGQRGLLNTTEARNAYLREAEMRNTDWFDVLFTNAVSQNHSVSITAGTEKSSFYASLSAMLDPGWYKQSKVKRYTANVNTTYNIYKNLSLNLISNASYRQQNAPGTMNSTLDIASGKMSRGFDINPYSYALNTSRTLDPSVDYISNYAPFNILHELDNNYIEINMAIEEFGRRQILSQRHINNIDLIFEELCVQTLLGRMGDEIRLGFAVEVSEVSEADESCLVTVTYGGNALKPLMGCSDSLSMVPLSRMVRQYSHRFQNGNTPMHLPLSENALQISYNSHQDSLIFHAFSISESHCLK